MTANRMLALVFVAAAIVFLTVMIPELQEQQANMGGGFYSVGASALPTFAGAMVLLFGGMMLFADRPEPEDTGRFQTGLGLGLLQIGLFAAYALGLSLIGFLPASILFLAAVFLLYRAENWVVAGVLTIGMPVVVDALLRKVFLVPLPGAAFF